MSRLSACLFIVLSACGVRALSPEPDPNQVLAVTNVTVLPMTENTSVTDQTVLIRDGRIQFMGASDSLVVPEGAHIVDGTGRFLMPSLADMHAHARRRAGNRLEDYLRQGVTIIRNMQGEESHLAFRGTGSRGPIFRTAGPAIAGRRLDSRHQVTEDPDEARALVREHFEAGYDYVKVYSLLSQEVYEAILDEAQTVGIPVIGHVSDSVPLAVALEAGQSSIEHLYGYFWALESETSSIRGGWVPRRLFHAVEIDDDKLPAVAHASADAGVWNCPTLWRKDNYLTSPLAVEDWENPALRELGHQNRLKMVKALHDAGAGLLAGTDDRAEVIHGELALFVKAGLSPFEALETSTVNAAEYLGMADEIGTVEEGKRAHLLLLEANPLQAIENTTQIVGVFVDSAWTPVFEE